MWLKREVKKTATEGNEGVRMQRFLLVVFVCFCRIRFYWFTLVWIILPALVSAVTVKFCRCRFVHKDTRVRVGLQK